MTPYSSHDLLEAGEGQASHGALGQASHGALGQASHAALGQASHGALGQTSHGALGQTSHAKARRETPPRWPTPPFVSTGCSFVCSFQH